MCIGIKTLILATVHGYGSRLLVISLNTKTNHLKGGALRFPFLVSMDWESYRESFTTHSHTALGRRLKPFCLAHQFYLSTLNSPLLAGKTVSLPQLEVATIICSSDIADIPRRLTAKVTLLRHAKWWWKLARYSFEEELANFDAYLSDVFAPPEIKQTTSSKNKKVIERGEVGARLPAELALACAIIKATGWSEEVVWSMPLGKLHWYSAGFRSLEDPDFQLVTDGDKNYKAMLDKLIADGRIQRSKN